eukprot:TRINITY_DN15222_c0_g1_i1.p1 TRINITY_DN15222_c0_g1~~TRINITY_DN15222_c0_g1_i1.p1  ORF type:complete len:294 (+),score=33.96 TRINITY_DN15222_c0_g1_i1:58-939(+)
MGTVKNEESTVSGSMHKPVAYEGITRRTPWATNVVAGTGLSHTHAEFNAQTNLNFRHYLKKAYRKLHIKSNLSECTERSGDSDPNIPDYTKRKHLAIKFQKKTVSSDQNWSPTSMPPPKRFVGRRRGPLSDTTPNALFSDESEICTSKSKINVIPIVLEDVTVAKPAPTCTSFPLPVRDRSVNSYWPRKAADIKKEKKGRPRFRPPRTSLCATWSEERRGQKRKSGKSFKVAGETRSMVGVHGFSAVPPKPFVRGWSRESINRVVKAAEEQFLKSSALDEPVSNRSPPVPPTP